MQIKIFDPTSDSLTRVKAIKEPKEVFFHHLSCQLGDMCGAFIAHDLGLPLVDRFSCEKQGKVRMRNFIVGGHLRPIERATLIDTIARRIAEHYSDHINTIVSGKGLKEAEVFAQSITNKIFQCIIAHEKLTPNALIEKMTLDPNIPNELSAKADLPAAAADHPQSSASFRRV